MKQSKNRIPAIRFGIEINSPNSCRRKWEDRKAIIWRGKLRKERKKGFRVSKVRVIKWNDHPHSFLLSTRLFLEWQKLYQEDIIAMTKTTFHFDIFRLCHWRLFQLPRSLHRAWHQWSSSRQWRQMKNNGHAWWIVWLWSDFAVATSLFLRGWDTIFWEEERLLLVKFSEQLHLVF